MPRNLMLRWGWYGMVVGIWLVIMPAISAAQTHKLKVSGGCLSVSAGPFAGALPGTGPIQTSFSTFQSAASFPRHVLLPDGHQVFNNELVPASQSAGTYRASYVSFDALGATNQYGQINLSLPTTDTDMIGLPDILQINHPGSASFVGSGSVYWPIGASFGIAGGLTRAANTSVGTFSATLTIPGVWSVNYNGPIHLLVLSGEASYERIEDQGVPYLSAEPDNVTAPKNSELRLSVAVDHKITFALKRLGSSGSEESLIGTTAFTILNENELATPSFVLSGSNSEYRVKPLSLKLLGGRYSGRLSFEDGDLLTPWVDYAEWVIVLVDDNDTDSDGIPDLTDATPDPMLLFQWFRDGAQIAGATSSNLTLHTLAGVDTGGYWATAHNNQGSITSRTARVTVSDCQWAASAGGSGVDVANRIAVSPEGAVYLGGVFYKDAQAGSTQMTNIGRVNAFIARYSRTGSVDWVLPLQSTGSIAAIKASVAADGSLRFCGSFDGGLIVGTNNLAGAGSFVGRADAAGRMAWLRPTVNSIRITAVAVDSAGSLFAAGTAEVGGEISGASVDPGIVVAKYGADGALLWASSHYIPSITSYDQPQINGVALDARGGVVITGSFYGRDLGGYSRQGVIMSWDKSGTENWTREFGGNGTDEGREIAVDRDGSICLAASIRSSWLEWDHSVIRTYTSDSVMALLKITSSGDLLWSRTLGGGPLDGNAVIGLAGDGRGHICLYAQYYQTGGPFQLGGLSLPDRVGENTTLRAFLSEFDSAGRLDWLWQIPATVSIPSGGVAYDRGANLVVTSTYRGNAHPNATSFTSAGETDILVFKLARPPVIEMERTPGGLRISWPIAWWDSRVESTDSIDSGGLWKAVSGTASSTDFDLGIVVPIDSKKQFYRLNLWNAP